MDRIPYSRLLFGVFCFFVVLYVSLTRGNFISTDEVQVYQPIKSLWENGNLSITSSSLGVAGRNAHFYGLVNSGQSIAAMPLFAIGRILKTVLPQMGQDKMLQIFSGKNVSMGDVFWGGEIEMFFVDLLNAVITAMLAAVFFAFCVKTGAQPRWALAATFLLGLTTLPGSYSSTFFQQPSECLFQLWVFYFLFDDAQRPSAKSRFMAGLLAAVMIQFRYPAVIALPGLTLYHILIVWRRRPVDIKVKESLVWMITQSAQFLGMLFFGLILHAVDQYTKFETIFAVGNYAKEGFTTPLSVGLYGFLFSPGSSIFIYSPITILFPWALIYFFRRYKIESFFIFFQLTAYLLFFSKFLNWHGMWAFGPRYLCAVIPLILLPLATWMENQGQRVLVLIGLLGIAGLWVQIIHFVVNFWNVVVFEKYLDFKPLYQHLFIWKMSPLWAHTKALFAADWRVEMWLVNVYRNHGGIWAVAFLIPCILLIGISLLGIVKNIRIVEAQSPQKCEVSFRPIFLPIVSAILFCFLATGYAWTADYELLSLNRTGVETVENLEQYLMERGLKNLRINREPKKAIPVFECLLKLNSKHFGATFQLARSLDAAGRTRDSLPWYKKALDFAKKYGDKITAELAQDRLAEIQKPLTGIEK
ncbi:MAG: hypothetical protein WA705_13805 [Candidatus Ozemobacteraceae bacterium]